MLLRLHWPQKILGSLSFGLCLCRLFPFGLCLQRNLITLLEAIRSLWRICCVLGNNHLELRTIWNNLVRLLGSADIPKSMIHRLLRKYSSGCSHQVIRATSSAKLPSSKALPPWQRDGKPQQVSHWEYTVVDGFIDGGVIFTGWYWLSDVCWELRPQVTCLTCQKESPAAARPAQLVQTSRAISPRLVASIIPALSLAEQVAHHVLEIYRRIWMISHWHQTYVIIIL